MKRPPRMTKRYRQQIWRSLWLAGTLSALLALPSLAPARVSLDYRVMLEEYQAGGGLQFYAKTEEFLRLGEFEQALFRYRFLKGQVEARPEYRALVTALNQRLRLLKRQMHLTDTDIQPLPRWRVARSARSGEPGIKPPEPASPPSQTTDRESTAGKPTAADQRPAPPSPIRDNQGPTATGVSPTPARPPDISPPGSPPASGKTGLQSSPSSSKPSPPVPSSEPLAAQKKSPAPSPSPPKKSFWGWLKSFFN